MVFEIEQSYTKTHFTQATELSWQEAPGVRVLHNQS